MSIALDPMDGVPDHVHDLMPPYLRVSIRLGRMVAEQAVAVTPLPWPDDLAAFVCSEAVKSLDDTARKEMPDLPEFVFTAMHRQLVKTLSDRLDEIYAASGAHPEGGQA